MRGLTARTGRVSRAARRARFPRCAQDRSARSVRGVGFATLCRPERLAHAGSVVVRKIGRLAVSNFSHRFCTESQRAILDH
jgi:hypothetical protein